jgi:hypothetical protein
VRKVGDPLDSATAENYEHAPNGLWLALQPGLAEAATHNMLWTYGHWAKPRLGGFQVLLRLAHACEAAQLGPHAWLHAACI